MYWLLMSERTDEYELSIDHLPPLVHTLGLHLDQGDLVRDRLPMIDIPFVQHAEERKTDNIIVPTRLGLLINGKVKEIFDGLGIRNVQYFEARLIEQRTQTLDESYYVANVIGKKACVDLVESELEYFDDGDIQFIDKLVLHLKEAHNYGHIFRLAEFPALLVISQLLKDRLVENKVTGFKMYKPEEFSH